MVIVVEVGGRKRRRSRAAGCCHMKLESGGLCVGLEREMSEFLAYLVVNFCGQLADFTSLKLAEKQGKNSGLKCSKIQVKTQVKWRLQKLHMMAMLYS